ncbi:MAG TPA: hypothetical protein VOA87_10030, partial [Thermoanaerobaculia bacterium]|nr:hypothetical protein [Thermoanaerobaculia bacterium]
MHHCPAAPWLLLATALAALAAAPAAAQPLPRERVPEPLRPWTDWALRGQESALCPYLLGDDDETRCVWPGRLALDLGEKGGTFQQAWSVEVAGFVPLPGDDRRWPLDLRLDGKPAAAVTDDDRPALWLAPGSHTISGVFRWDSVPESLPVPAKVGLLALRVRGAAVPFPERDGSGQVFLQRSAATATEEEKLEILVSRRVIDEVPLLLVTRIRLAVAGKAREVLLGRALPPGFIPVALTGPLPARLEPDGRLRAQVRPGTWTLELVARYQGPAAELALPPPGGPWANEEIWAFDARPSLRVVDVLGAQAVDPQQTALPDDWKRLPAYRLRPGETLRLAERQRGDAAPDKLALERVLWLDFDGGGYTWQDRLSGTLSRNWRLEMAPPSRLERVVIDGRDQVITRRAAGAGGAAGAAGAFGAVGAGGAAGVEVRQGQLLVAAEGRIPGRFALPAVSWDHDFQQVSGVLNLPPGWKLLAATGVDEAPGTWFGLWTLLDLFLVLLIALAVRHLWGNRWGLLALAAMVLTWQEAEAPRWTWLAVLAGAALLRMLPAEGRLRSFVRLFQAAALVALALVTVAFLVQQIRQAIHPALEHPYTSVGAEGAVVDRTLQASLRPQPPEGAVSKTRADQLHGLGYLGGKVKQEPEAAVEEKEEETAPTETAAGMVGGAGVVAPKPLPPPAVPSLIAKDGAPGRAYGAALQEVDPKAVVNTGPGLPAWQWNQVRLSWSGPVERHQRIRFFLLGPGANFVLAFLRAALLALLVLRILGLAAAPPTWRRPPAAAALLVLLGVLLAALLAPPGAAAADIPPQDLLDKLGKALTEKPACHPHCAASPRLFVEASPALLRLRFEVGAAAAVAVPIPGGAQQWVPAEVQVDGAQAGVVRSDDGRLWVRVGPGRHEILASGPLPPRDLVQIPLPLKPHHAEASASGWTIDGIHEDGAADDSLQLSRSRGAGAASGALQPGELPPFLEVDRTLHFGLTWQMETRVQRLSPLGTPAVAAVPLLPGESVTTAGIRVEKGAVQVSLGPQAFETSWTSTLEVGPEIVLTAPRTLAWTEVWRLDASPIWHFEARGIPAVQPAEGLEKRVPEWRPWPGETVKLAVSRPEGVAGQSLTVERSVLAVTPGLRATEVRLDLALRSSRGGLHVVALPERAELTGVAIDGRPQPIRQEGRQVALPIHPGAQQIALAWREDRGASLFFRTPAVDLKIPSVNALVTLENPAGRWILLLGGPRLGPAVLFWSLLLVIVLVAAALGRLAWTPLGTL